MSIFCKFLLEYFISLHPSIFDMVSKYFVFLGLECLRTSFSLHLIITYSWSLLIRTIIAEKSIITFPFHFRHKRCCCSVMVYWANFSKIRKHFISLEVEVLKKLKLWAALLPDGLASLVPYITLRINSFLKSLSFLGGIGGISYFGWEKKC